MPFKEDKSPCQFVPQPDSAGLISSPVVALHSSKVHLEYTRESALNSVNYAQLQLEACGSDEFLISVAFVIVVTLLGCFIL